MLAWRQLVNESDQQLAARDVAEVHLACAEGLPDAANIDVDLCLDRLDYYARRVRSFTESRMPQFHRKRWDYNNSEAYFRILCMITVLQRDLGVRYNPAKRSDEAPLDTADTFIHGILFGDGGICGSLAVLYVAVGRRLGYPLKLVKVHRGPHGHLFPRWDEPGGERFNIEATNQGLGCFSDDYYRTGIFETDPDIERRCCLLQSMTPRQELADFLGCRGHRWVDLTVYRRAVESFAWASVLAPQNEAYLSTAWILMNRWREAMNLRKPASFPEIYTGVGERRYPECLPGNVELSILGLEAVETLLMDPRHEREWWGPLRRGLGPEVPSAAFVDFVSDTSYHVRFKYARSRPLSFSITTGA
jgi:hypothetical protein